MESQSTPAGFCDVTGFELLCTGLELLCAGLELLCSGFELLCTGFELLCSGFALLCSGLLLSSGLLSGLEEVLSVDEATDVLDVLVDVLMLEELDALLLLEVLVPFEVEFALSSGISLFSAQTVRLNVSAALTISAKIRFFSF